MSNNSRLGELIAEADRLRQESDEAAARLKAAEEAVLQERFGNLAHFQRDDIILVPRTLFGEIKWWPAKIVGVTLRHTEGVWPDTYKQDPGGHWESYLISYAVFLQQKDGTFGGSTQGFNHSQVKAMP